MVSSVPAKQYHLVDRCMKRQSLALREDCTNRPAFCVTKGYLLPVWENDVAQTLRGRAPQSVKYNSDSLSLHPQRILVEVSSIIPHPWPNNWVFTATSDLKARELLASDHTHGRGTFEKWQSSESPFTEHNSLAIQLIRGIQLLFDFPPPCGRGMWQMILLGSLFLFDSTIMCR